MWGWAHGSGWWMLFAGFAGLLFWGSIIALAVWAIRRVTDDRPGDGWYRHHKSPMEFLKERYARGEISKEEYDRIKRDLEND